MTISESITYRTPACGELFDDYKDSLLFLDTTAMISASRYEDFLRFLIRLSRCGCELLTIPSAKYEFTRMAKNDQALKKCEDMLDSINIDLYRDLESKIDTLEIKQYLMLYNNCVNKDRSQRKAPSFTDSLLCIVLYLYRHSKRKVRLMTANYTDIPIQYFRREEMITIDAGAGTQVESIYSFNNENFDRVCQSFYK